VVGGFCLPSMKDNREYTFLLLFNHFIMINRKLKDIHNGIVSCQDLPGVKFSYAMAKNKKKIEGESANFQEAMKMSEEYQKYDKERITLAEKHSKKDKDGNPITITNIQGAKSFDIIDMDKFEKDFAVIKGKNKEVLNKRVKQMEEFEKLMDEEVKIKLTTVKIDDLPQEITTKQIEALNELIV